MTCEEFGAMLDKYESITDEEKLAMNEHASVCVNCREELDFMLAIIAQLNTLPEIQPPADFAVKLNKRLDLERSQRGFEGIFVSVKRNYRRYSTVAACLMLAVVIGANGKMLLNRMSADTDSPTVITAEDMNAPPAATETARISDTAEQPAAVENNINVAANKPSGQDVSKKSAQIQHIKNMSESINQIDMNSVNKPSEPVYEGNGVSAQDKSRTIPDANTGIAAMSLEGEAEPQNYTIARGVYRLPDPEIAQAELEGTPMNGTEVLQIAEIGSKNESTIARGRYYIPADEGYIEIADNAIGVDSADAQRAAELIQQYAEKVDDSYYVINSKSIPSMLEHMDGEGINYQNNVGNAGNEKVSFKLVIE